MVFIRFVAIIFFLLSLITGVMSFYDPFRYWVNARFGWNLSDMTCFILDVVFLVIGWVINCASSIPV